MHYLQGHFDSALGKLVTHLVPSHRYISVHDLLNPELFHLCLLASIAQVPQLASSAQALALPAMVREGDSGLQGGYIEQRMHNFTTICEIMSEAFDALCLPNPRTTKEALFRMVKHAQLDQLQSLLEQLFELIIRNRDIVEFITTLPEEDQFIIKDFLQRARSRLDVQFQEEAQQVEHEDEKRRLEEENGELRNLLAGKEGELDQAHHHIHDLEDQIAELRELELVKEANIEGLKRRLIAYEETDSLFQEKDEEIFKLQRQIGELQIANRLMSSELKSEKDRLEGKVRELERSNAELQTKCEKLVNSYQLLAKQREDTEASHKKVRDNLKDMLNTLNLRCKQLSAQLVESQIEKQLREREYNSILGQLQSLKSQSSEITHRPREQSIDRVLVTSSSGHGHGREFLPLEQDLHDLQQLQENAFEEQIMMFESGQDNLKKVQEIIAQNARLKERLSAQEARGGKELFDENEKLRKRLAILRRKADEIESTHRQEMNLMVSAFDLLLQKPE